MIGIMGAIPEEVGAIIEAMGEGTKAVLRGMRTYHQGVLWGVPVVAVYSRVGKVAAASTATHLITEYNVERIIFTGVAGGVTKVLNVGDIVVAGDLYQHDMDARPLFERHEIPLLGMSRFPSSPMMREQCLAAAKLFITEDLPKVIDRETLEQFGITQPKVIEAGIASGDRFFADHKDSQDLALRLPVGCVEMEGAAVAQVCHEYGIDYSVIRTISDSAGSNAHIDFTAFIEKVAAIYSYGILKRLLTKGKENGRN